MYFAVKSAMLRDKKLVWIDETVFTFNTFRKRAWAGKYSRITISDADAQIKTIALIAAISEGSGLEAFALHPLSINTEDFIAFIHLLLDKFGNQEFAIFMDNLRVHKSKQTLEVCKTLKVQPIFNVPYSPDFNGIETYFSLIKGQYKNMLLQKLIKGIRPDSSLLV